MMVDKQADLVVNLEADKVHMVADMKVGMVNYMKVDMVADQGSRINDQDQGSGSGSRIKDQGSGTRIRIRIRIRSMTTENACYRLRFFSLTVPFVLFPTFTLDQSTVSIRYDRISPKNGQCGFLIGEIVHF